MPKTATVQHAAPDCRSQRQIEVMKLLLEKGAAVDAKDSNGSHRLRSRCGKVTWTWRSCCWKKGAAVDAKTQRGFYAAYVRHPAMVLDLVELLLDKNAAVDAKNEKGATPLMIAVTKGRIDVVKLFA